MEESWVNAALSQHEYDTSHSGNQHGSVRSHFVQLLGKQSRAELFTIPKALPCVSDESAYIKLVYIYARVKTCNNTAIWL